MNEAPCDTVLQNEPPAAAATSLANTELSPRPPTGGINAAAAVFL